MTEIRIPIEIVFNEESVAAIKQLVQSNEQRRMEVSRRAIYGAEGPPENEAMLLSTREVAEKLSVSSRTIYKMHTEGEMPRPIRIGRAVRWGRRELQAWVDAGCPSMRDWNWEP